MKYIGPFVIANLVMGNGETTDMVAPRQKTSSGESSDFETILTKLFGKVRDTEEIQDDEPELLELEDELQTSHSLIPTPMAISPLANLVNTESGGGDFKVEALATNSVEASLLSLDESPKVDAGELLAGIQHVPAEGDYGDLGEVELGEVNLEIDVPEGSFASARFENAASKPIEKLAVTDQGEPISEELVRFKGQSASAESPGNAHGFRLESLKTLATDHSAIAELKEPGKRNQSDLLLKDKPVRQVPSEQVPSKNPETDVLISEQPEVVAMDADFWQVSLAEELEHPAPSFAEFPAQAVVDSLIDDANLNRIDRDKTQVITESVETSSEPLPTSEESLSVDVPKVVSQPTQNSQTQKSRESEEQQSSFSVPKTKERIPLDKHTDLVATDFRVQEPKVETPELETPIREVLDLEDRENLFPKLVKSIESLVTDERSEVRIQLKPDHLGELKIKLSLERGIMVAEFIVQSESVREVIASQLPQLHTALQQQGTQVADVQINIGMGHKEQDHRDQPRSRQFNYGSQTRMAKPSAVGVNKSYLGGSIWNQVDVKV